MATICKVIWNMILFVDETENDSFFIVTGLLVNSQADIVDVYKRFKKSW